MRSHALIGLALAWAACGRATSEHAADGVGQDLSTAPVVDEVRIVVEWSGASPEELERQVAQPLEDALAAHSEVRGLRARVSPGRVEVAVDIVSDAGGNDALVVAREAVQAIRSRLPEDADVPMVTRPARGRRWLVLSDPQRPSSELHELVPFLGLELLAGVRDVTSCGGGVREIVVTIDPTQLAGRGLGLDAVTAALARAREEAAGRLIGDGRELVLRAHGGLSSIAELDELVVAVLAGVPVRLRDVATIEDTLAPSACRAFLGDGRVVAVEVGNDGRELALDEVHARLPPGVTLSVVRGDEAVVAAPAGVDVAAFMSWAGHAARATGALVVALLEPPWRAGQWPPPTGPVLVVVGASPDQLLPPPAAAQQELQVTIDRAAAARLGVSIADVARVVRIAHVGEVVAYVVEGARQRDVRVRVPGERLADVTIDTATGQRVPLSALVSVTTGRAPEPILRKDRRRIGRP